MNRITCPVCGYHGAVTLDFRTIDGGRPSYYGVVVYDTTADELYMVVCPECGYGGTDNG